MTGKIAAASVVSLLLLNGAAWGNTSYVSGAACAGIDSSARDDIDFNTWGAANTSSSARRTVFCPLAAARSGTNMYLTTATIYARDKHPGTSNDGVKCELKLRTTGGSIYSSGTTETSGSPGQTSITTSSLSGSSRDIATAFVWCGIPETYSGSTSSVMAVAVNY